MRTLKGHGHWVNTLALSSEHAIRTGAFDHQGHCPSSPAEAKVAALERYVAGIYSTLILLGPLRGCHNRKLASLPVSARSYR